MSSKGRKAYSCEALGLKRVPASVQLLGTRLQHYDEEVRSSAYRGIEKLGAPEEPLVDTVLDLLTHQNWYARDAAAHALGHCTDAGSAVAAATAAVTKLEHAQPHVRFTAGRALVHIVEQANGDHVDAPGAKEGAELSAASLAERLKHENPSMRKNALDALSRMGSQTSAHASEVCALITDPQLSVRNEVIRLVSRVGKFVAPAVDVLAAGLGHAEEPIRRSAKRALTELSRECGAEVATAVAATLQSENPVARISALDQLQSLGTLSGPHGSEIAVHLEDPSPEVRLRAVHAIVGCGKAALPCLGDLKRHSHHANHDVSRAAVQALRGLACQCAKVAKSACKDLEEEPDVNLRRIAIEVIGGAGHNSTPFLDELAKALEDKDWGLRRAAIEALCDLEEHAEPAGAEVARRLLHHDPDVRRAAAEALGRMGLHAGEFGHRVEGLADTEEDPDVKNTCAMACELLYAAGMAHG